MRIYLGGHLSFYHPNKERWLEVDLSQPTPLTMVLLDAGIPMGEVELVSINGVLVDLTKAVITAEDQVRLYSAVGGG